MTGVVITEAGPAELDQVRAVIVRANEQFRSVLDPAAFDPYLRLACDVEGRAALATVLTARIDDQVVGTATFFAVAADEGWGAEADTSGLRAMAVDPAARGAGVGRLLVDACVERARAVGATALTLHTADWLGDAIRLYERCGFVRDPAGDHRASDLMGVPPHADYAALAYRLLL